MSDEKEKPKSFLDRLLAGEVRGDRLGPDSFGRPGTVLQWAGQRKRVARGKRAGSRGVNR
jgi:hypothetical protein